MTASAPEDNPRPEEEPQPQDESQAEDESQPEDEPAEPLCGNCETLLTGPFCHMCGQAVRSPVREFFSFMFDSATEFMRPDGKFFRSLAALYFRPGLLTTRYLAGQRMSFIKPVKLYLSLSLVLFLLVSFELSFKTGLRPVVKAKGTDVTMGFEGPVISAEKATDAATPNAATAKPTTVAAKPELPRDAERALIVVDNDKFVDFNVKGKPWHETDNPLVVSWLPGFANNWLNGKLTRLNEVGDEAQKHPERVLESLFRVLPTMMFLLLPVFALVLKLLYVFRRRLYAEHLLVAVQSHSFIFLSFILLILLTDVAALMGPNVESYTTPLAFIVGFWIPIYLFMMQKRVYRQGWFWTTFKYVIGGFTYSMLLSIGLTFSIVAALVNM